MKINRQLRTKNNMKNKSILAALLASAAIISSAGAATLYLDEFNGAGANNLSGTTPGTTIGTNTWSASNTQFKADGSVATTGNGGVWLPFTPSAGNIYSLSADLNPTVGGQNWFAIGFSTLSGNARFTDTGAPGLGNALIRSNRGTAAADQGQYFAGRQTNGPTLFDTPTGVVNVNITLNASNADSSLWTQTLSINGTAVALVTSQPNTGTYADIRFVGMSVANTAGGTVDNFKLETIPEPTTALLGLIGTLTLLRRRRA